MKKIILFLILFGVASASSSFETRLRYRRDHLRWQIGSDKIDIVSELTWRKLNILEGQFQYETSIGRCWLFWGEFAIGGVLSGECQDSDYDQSGRRMEFSRSYSDVTGISGDWTLGFARHFGPCWTGQIGLSYHTIYLRNWGLRFTVQKPNSLGYGAVDDVPKSVCWSTYRPELVTTFLGVEWRKPLEKFDLVTSFQAHIGTYYAHADWKLRSDIDYMFDVAIVYGLKWSLDAEWRLSKHWVAIAGVGVDYWRDIVARKGFVENGEVKSGMYLGVQWVSISANLGLRYCF